MNRRDFLEVSALCGVTAAVAQADGTALPAPALIGKLSRQSGATPIDGAVWYTGEARGDGLEWRFPPARSRSRSISGLDMLLDGTILQFG